MCKRVPTNKAQLQTNTAGRSDLPSLLQRSSGRRDRNALARRGGSHFLLNLLLPSLLFLHFLLHLLTVLLLQLLRLQLRQMTILDLEEHGRQLREPLRIHGRHTVHIFLGRHDQFVVHDVIGRVAEAVERAGRMELARRAGEHVHVGPDALDPRRVEEIGGTNAFPHDVPIVSAGHVLHFLLLHQLQQLVAHAAHAHHGLSVDVVSLAPRHAVLGALPLQENVEVREMVALRDREIGVDVVGFFLVLRGPIEDLPVSLGAESYVGDGQHGHDHDALRGASHLLGHHHHFLQVRVQRVVHHLVAQLAQPARVGQRAQHPQLIHGVRDVVLGRRVHEVEVVQILHAQLLQQQHHVAQIGSLDLGHLVPKRLVHVHVLGVHSEAHARTGSPGATGALVRVGLGHGGDLQRVHSDRRVEHFQLAESRVHDVLDAVHRQRGLGDVRAHHALAEPLGRLFEHQGLLGRGLQRVHGKHQQRIGLLLQLAQLFVHQLQRHCSAPMLRRKRSRYRPDRS